MQKFVNSFREFYWVRGWNLAGTELFAEVVRALQRKDDEESVSLHALAMAYQGYFMSWLGLSDQGYELAVESAKILEPLNRPEMLAFAYESLSLNAYCLNKFLEEIIGKNRLLKIANDIDDKWLLALALFEASMVALRKMDYGESAQLAEASLKLNIEIGNTIRSTLSLLALGHTAFARDEYKLARDYYLRCSVASQETGFLWGIEKSSKYLGKVALSIDKIEEAEKYLLQSLWITTEIGLVRDILNLFFEYACLLVAKGNTEQAVELLILVLQHPVSHQIRLGEGLIKDSVKDLLVKLEDELPPETYKAALERGQTLEIDDVIHNLLGSTN